MKINLKSNASKFKKNNIKYLTNNELSNYKIIDGVFIFETNEKEYINPIELESYISINYAHEGSIELKYENHKFIILSSMNAIIGNHKSIVNDFSFISSFYRGINIVLDLKSEYTLINSILDKVVLDESFFENKFELINNTIKICEEKKILALLEQIYLLKKENNTEFLKIKILELIYYIKNEEEVKKQKKKIYFDKKQIEKIHKIQNFITENPEKHHTIEKLSKEFNISETTLKKCFKEIYNNSIYDYLKNHRILLSADMLLRTDLSITEIALSVGYLNASKFSNAFKQILRKTPSEYRRSKNN